MFEGACGVGICWQSSLVELDTLGFYSLLKDETGAPALLGHGAWGAVYKAFDNDLNCYVALRIIGKNSFPDDTVREQFVNQVRLASHIHHPNLASIFPLNVIDDKYLYAAEFCDGETLTARVGRDGYLEAVPALSVISQIAAGLEVAQSAGLLHRNINAENVLLTQEEDEISVKVLDVALPAGPRLEGNSLSHRNFLSPEEIAGERINERSSIYSLGALLYYIRGGPEKYASFRAKSLANEEVAFDDASDISPQVAKILTRALDRNPEKRFVTLAELRTAIDEALHAPKYHRAGDVAPSRQAESGDNFAATQELSPVEAPRPGSGEARPPIGSVAGPASRAQGLTIPAKLLSSAQPGTLLRLRRHGEASEELIACVRNRFRIGRSAGTGADLTTRFLPRNKANDAKTKRLSRIHVTAQCENGKIHLFDGDSRTPSANGSSFDAQVLSTDTPVTLLKPGELRLADAYSIRVFPSILKTNEPPRILNIAHWKGPVRASNPLLAGAVVFAPKEPNQIRVAIWLFSVAPFRSSETSPLDFGLPAQEEEIGALHYHRDCFWLEQKSADAVSINGLALAPAEIAPLVSGQVLEVRGEKYSVEIEDGNKAAEQAG
jgi:serine/threonine protein kinase